VFSSSRTFRANPTTERLHDAGCNALDPLPCALRMLLDEVLHEDRNVLTPLAQGGIE
jgi:hypothetical protein